MIPKVIAIIIIGYTAGASKLDKCNALITKFENTNQIFLTEEVKREIIQLALNSERMVNPNSQPDAKSFSIALEALQKYLNGLGLLDGKSFEEIYSEYESEFKIRTSSHNHYGILIVRSNIKQSEIWIDDMFISRYTDVKLVCTSGKKQISIKHAGYLDCNTDVEVADNRLDSIYCTLSR